MRRLAVFPTVALSILSFYVVLRVGEGFGVSPSDFHSETSGFRLSVQGVALALLLAPLAVVWGAQRWIHRTSLTELGFRRLALRESLLGIGAGLLFQAVVECGRILLADKYSFVPSIPGQIGFMKWLAHYGWFLFMLTLNSISEEVVYRAYPIENLLRSPRDRSWVVIGTGVIFSLMHYLTDAPSIQNFLYRALFGVLMAMVYLEWRLIWPVVGFHTGSNLIVMAFSKAGWSSGGLWHLEIVGTSAIAGYLESLFLVVLIAAFVVCSKSGRIPARRMVRLKELWN